MTQAYYELVPKQIFQDYALAFCIIVSALLAVAAAYLSRETVQFRAVAALVSRVSVPLYVVAMNPLLALVAAPASVLPLPRRIPRPMLLTMALAFVVRVPQLFQDLWFDESFSVRMAQLDLNGFIRAIPEDVHPPLFNALLFVWGRIGGWSYLWLRLPELAFGLLAVLLMFHAAKALKLDERTAQIAALVTALMPAAIYFSAELRSYAMLACIALGLLLCILNNRPRLFAVLAVLMVLTHHYGILYAVVMSLAGFAYWRDRRWFASGAVVAAALLLWSPFVLSQSGNVRDGFWIFNSPGKLLTTMIDMTLKATQESNFVWLMLPSAALLGLGFYAARRWITTRPAFVWSALVFGIPALSLLISYAFTPIFVPRYLYPSMIALAIPIAIAVSKSANVGRFALALALVGMGVALIMPRPPFRALVNEHCPQATAFYHPNMESAFILRAAFPQQPHLVYRYATDQGAALTPDDIATFDFVPGLIQDFAGQTVCMMSIQSILVQPYEQHMVSSFTRDFPHTVGTYWDSGITFTFYQFEVQ